MKENILIQILNDVLKTYNFKKKGSNWLHEENTFIKKINLQKSYYSNSYYINYGYIIKDLDLNGLFAHIGGRLISKNKNENEYIFKLLNLESDISEQERNTALKKIVKDLIIKEFNQVNTLEDLKEMIQQEYFQAAPSIVKEYLNI